MKISVVWWSVTYPYLVISRFSTKPVFKNEGEEMMEEDPQLQPLASTYLYVCIFDHTHIFGHEHTSIYIDIYIQKQKNHSSQTTSVAYVSRIHLGKKYLARTQVKFIGMSANPIYMLISWMCDSWLYWTLILSISNDVTLTQSTMYFISLTLQMILQQAPHWTIKLQDRREYAQA